MRFQKRDSKISKCNSKNSKRDFADLMKRESKNSTVEHFASPQLLLRFLNSIFSQLSSHFQVHERFSYCIAFCI